MLCGESASALCWVSSFMVMFVTVVHVLFVMFGGRPVCNVGCPRGFLFLAQGGHHCPGHSGGPEGSMMKLGGCGRDE